jgi:putative DNA primase/helicase
VVRDDLEKLGAFDGIAAPREVFEIRCETRTPTPTDFLIHPHLPCGECTWFEGQTKTGKTTVAIDIAARISRGRAWIDGTPMKHGRIAMMTCEDDVDRTLIPRLIAAGADLSRVRVLQVRTELGEGVPSLAHDLVGIEERLQAGGYDLLVIDGTFGVLGVKDGNSYADSYKAMTPVTDMVRRLNIATILVRHVRKAAGSALNAGLGSVGYGALARSIVSFAIDHDDDRDRLMAHAGGNLGVTGPTYKYRIVDGEPIPGFERTVGAIEWGEAVDKTADEIMATRAPTDGSESEIAADWLAEHLGALPRVARELREAAESDGVSPRTLQRVARKLGVVMVRGNQYHPATWALPLAPEAALASHSASGASTPRQSSDRAGKACSVGVCDEDELAPSGLHQAELGGLGASSEVLARTNESGAFQPLLIERRSGRQSLR